MWQKVTYRYVRTPIYILVPVCTFLVHEGERNGHSDEAVFLFLFQSPASFFEYRVTKNTMWQLKKKRKERGHHARTKDNTLFFDSSVKLFCIEVG